jgi:hypothetical protein
MVLLDAAHLNVGRVMVEQVSNDAFDVSGQRCRASSPVFGLEISGRKK